MAAVILVFKLSDGTIRKLVIVDEPRPAMTTAQIAILVAVLIGIIIAILTVIRNRNSIIATTLIILIVIGNLSIIGTSTLCQFWQTQ